MSLDVASRREADDGREDIIRLTAGCYISACPLLAPHLVFPDIGLHVSDPREYDGEFSPKWNNFNQWFPKTPKFISPSYIIDKYCGREL